MGVIGRNPGEWQTEDIEALPLPPGVLIKDDSIVSLKLGDFAALGDLLRGLAGQEAGSDEA
jgi:hypothetical protein